MNIRKIKHITLVMLIIMSFGLMACGKEEVTKNDNQSSNSTTDNTLSVPQSTKSQPAGIVTLLDKSKASTDLQNCDNLRSAFLVSLYETKIRELANSELEKGPVCFEIQSVNDSIEILCQNNTNMNSIIEAVKSELLQSLTPHLNKDLDGSGVIQSQFYAVLEKGNDIEVKIYISGAGKTLQDLKNDTEGDGIYQCSPNICKEYKWK